MSFTIQVENVMPGAVAPWTGFQLGQVQSAAGKLAQAIHQRPRAMRHSKDQRCLAVFVRFRFLVPQDEEPGCVPRHVLDSPHQDIQIVDLGGKGACDSSYAFFRALRQCFCAPGRVVHSLCLPSMLADRSLALGQGLGMGPHHPDVLQLRATWGHEAMLDPEANLPHYPQVPLQQQVVGLVDGARDRVFHRQDAIVRLSALYGGKNVGETPLGQCFHMVAKLLSDGLFRVSTMLPLESHNRFRHDSLLSR